MIENGSESEADRVDQACSFEQVGGQLRKSLRQVFVGIPDCSMKPTDISRSLSVSRTMVSRTISAIGKQNTDETLATLPGPESLRAIINAAQKSNVPTEFVNEAMEAITAFADLIREQFGTRAAFNAAMSVKHTGTRDQFEQSSRYQVYKGMSQIFGIQSKAWISSVIFSRSQDGEWTNVTSVYGASSIRRLRPDMPIKLPQGIGPIPAAGQAPSGKRSFDMKSFYTNLPAPITSHEENGQVIHTFAPDIGNKGLVYDMISAIHVPQATPKIPSPQTVRRGWSVVPAMPVGLLSMDVLVQGDIFDNVKPNALIYNTSHTGKTNFKDPASDIKRISTEDVIEDMGMGISKLEMNDVPRYTEMLAHVCNECGHDPDEYQAYRYQIQYPVFGFQYVVGFDIPRQ